MVVLAQAGMDLGIHDVESLEQDDKVLIEFNGQDCNAGPLGDYVLAPSSSHIPWNVEDNKTHRCIISHQDVEEHLSLNFDFLISKKPAIFSVELDREKMLRFDKHSIGFYPCLLKFVAFYTDQTIDDEDDEVSMHSEALFARIILRVKCLDLEGWGANSINRFALRCGIDINLIHKIFRTPFHQVYDDIPINRNEMERVYKKMKQLNDKWIPESKGLDI